MDENRHHHRGHGGHSGHSGHRRLRVTVAAALFCALAYVCAITIKVPVMFLSLDIKDAIIVLCGLLFGPAAGLAVAITVPFLELVIPVNDTGVYGFIMNLLSSVTFVLTVSLIYKMKKRMTGAIIGLVSGVCAVTAVMMAANLLVTPYYMGVSTSDVASLIPTVLLPFNLVKAVLNAAIVLLLYKPLSTLLKRSGLVGPSGESTNAAQPSRALTLAVTGVAVGLIVASLLVVFLVLAG